MLDLAAMLVFDGESRTVLTDRIRTLVTELRLRLDLEARAHSRLVIEGCLTCSGGKEYRAMLDNLGQVQARCSDLLKEARVLRTALELAQESEAIREAALARAREIWSKP